MRNRGRTKLRFQPPVAGSDGFRPNAAAGGWGEGVNIGVLLKPAKGVKDEENGAVTTRQPYECEIRAHYALREPKIDTTWRVMDEEAGRTFNITGIEKDDSDFRWVTVRLVEGDPI